MSSIVPATSLLIETQFVLPLFLATFRFYVSYYRVCTDSNIISSCAFLQYNIDGE